MSNLFSTHPPTERRIERLDAIARELGASAGPPRPDLGSA
jgi:predicted Zn-dependent protease